MGRLTRTQSIVGKMDELAISMLDGLNRNSSTAEIDLTNKLDVFEKVAKWIAVKNKLEEDQDDGIASYKSRIYGEDSKPRGPRAKGESGGKTLDRLKSRIPTADASDPDSDSNDAVSEDAAAA